MRLYNLVLAGVLGYLPCTGEMYVIRTVHALGNSHLSNVAEAFGDEGPPMPASQW